MSELARRGGRGRVAGGYKLEYKLDLYSTHYYNDEGLTTLSLTLTLARWLEMDAQPPQDNGSSQQPDKDQPAQPARAHDDATMSDSQPADTAQPKEPEEEPLPDEILNASADDIMARTRLIDNDLKVRSTHPRGDVISLDSTTAASPGGIRR